MRDSLPDGYTRASVGRTSLELNIWVNPKIAPPVRELKEDGEVTNLEAESGQRTHGHNRLMSAD